MSAPSYIDVLEQYSQYRDTVHQLVESVLTSIVSSRLLHDSEAQHEAIARLYEAYPFVELLYTLDPKGVQIEETAFSKAAVSKQTTQKYGKGSDRSSRPYFQLAIKNDTNIVVTDPYLSSATHRLSVSALFRVIGEDGELKGFIVLNFNLPEMMSTLSGDTLRRQFQPFFRVIYALISVGLLFVVGLLLWDAFSGLVANLFNGNSDKIKPFGIIIFLTLGLAVFDLSKTILEEEVLMHKDIYRHVSTRRTITRFMTAILIAISIEALLLMFKSVMGDIDGFKDAVHMMLAAVALLIGLGLYVYLGARAEKQYES